MRNGGFLLRVGKKLLFLFFGEVKKFKSFWVYVKFYKFVCVNMKVKVYNCEIL